MKTEYRFGVLQGPFTFGENIISKIKEQQNLLDSSFNIIKLGICVYRKFYLMINGRCPVWKMKAQESEQWTGWDIDQNLSIDNKLVHQQIFISIINSDPIQENTQYQIGKTGILELEDIQIPDSSQIAFNRTMDDAVYINYVIKINSI